MNYHIHQRKDGRYEASQRAGVHPITHKLEYLAVRGKTYQEVEAKLDKINSSQILFGDYLREWIENSQKRCTPSTVHLYKSLARTHIEPCLGNLTLSQLNLFIIKRFLLRKAKNGSEEVVLTKSGDEQPGYLSDRSIQNLRDLLRYVMKTACENNLMETNYAEQVILRSDLKKGLDQFEN